MRNNCVAICGVIHEPSINQIKILPHEEAWDSFMDRDARIEPVKTDFNFVKPHPSALQGNGNQLIKNIIKQKAQDGLVLVGYHEDECLLHTLRHITEGFPHLPVYVVRPLCGARRHADALLQSFRQHPQVHMVHPPIIKAGLITFRHHLTAPKPILAA